MSPVAILLADGFDESEYLVPAGVLRQAGYAIEIVGIFGRSRIYGRHSGREVQTDIRAADAVAEHYDALIIPGGRSPDLLMEDPEVLDFVRRFARTGRPIAAICHGPLVLAAAGVIRNRTITAWPTVRRALALVGANVLNQPVVVDGPFITSRTPVDLDAFCSAILAQLGEAPSLHVLRS